MHIIEPVGRRIEAIGSYRMDEPTDSHRFFNSRFFFGFGRSANGQRCFIKMANPGLETSSDALDHEWLGVRAARDIPLVAKPISIGSYRYTYLDGQSCRTRYIAYKRYEGDIARLAKQISVISFRQRGVALRELIESCLAFNSRGVFHTDLTPTNILLDKRTHTLRLAIIDFEKWTGDRDAEVFRLSRFAINRPIKASEADLAGLLSIARWLFDFTDPYQPPARSARSNWVDKVLDLSAPNGWSNPLAKQIESLLATLPLTG